MKIAIDTTIFDKEDISYLDFTILLYYILGGESNKILWGLMVLCCIVFLPLIQYIKTKITSKN